MATATTAVDPDRQPPLRLDSILTIDLRLLSQSELHSLSLCSSSSFDLNRCDDIVIPKIDRSVFNESAGSRKQTYSRLRLAPAESSSTSAKTSIHRRTPHLRASHATLSNNINDPEQAENSQIIRMLKHLFKSDSNFDDLVPAEVENDSNVAVPALLNPEMKRKRGRPRKHENAVFLRPPVAKKMRNNTVKKVVVYDNDRDREIVNNRGVTVNVENLAGLEDPYGPEIRRRTEGMSTEDELLGFLSRLNGHWGSSRKKRRIVDASDIGDDLPKGWRLSLSIKKKEGRVWLFCRRYISPSGRQFESCKEVSTYLLSIIGEGNLDKPSHTHSNNCDDLALKGASGNAGDVVPEHIKRCSPVRNPSPPPSSLATDCGKQVTLDVGDPVDVQVGELYKCLKCFMIFAGKDDLLDHQVLAHKTERSQPDIAISNWILVNEGMFECQFCHRKFYERNQYNGHIGNHAGNGINTSEASQAPNAEKGVDSVFVRGVSDKQMPASFLAEGNVVAAMHSADFGEKLKYVSPRSDHKISSGTESKTDGLGHDLNTLAHGDQGGHITMDGDILIEESEDKTGKNCIIDDNEVPGTGKAADVVASTSGFCLGHEASMSIKESTGKIEASGETVDCVDDKSECLEQGSSSGGPLFYPFSNKQMGNASAVGKDMVGVSNSVGLLNQDAVSQTGPADDRSECIIEQRRSSGSGLLSPFSNELLGSASGVGKGVTGKSANVEMLNNAVSETGVLTSSICKEMDFHADMNDTNVCSTFDELSSEKEKVLNSESSSGVFHDHVGLDEDCVTEVKKISDSESHSLVSPNSDTFDAFNNAGLISSKEQVSPQKIGFAGSATAASVDQVNVNRLSYDVASSKLDGQFEVRSNAFGSYSVSGMNGVSTVEEEDKYKCRSTVSSWCGKECGNENVGNKVVTSIMEPRTHMNTENFDIENDVENGSSNKSREANLDNFHSFRNNASINNESLGSLGSSQNGLNAAGVMAFNTAKNLEFCSLVPAGNEQAFGFQDDVNGLYDGTMEECKQDGSERGLLNQFCIAETSDDIFGNKIYSTPLDGLKFDEDRDIGVHELSLAFGNPHALYADTISVEQKKDVNCAAVPSKIEDTFDVQTNLSMFNNSMVEDLKGRRESVGGLFSLSGNNETSAFQSNGNTVYPGRAWEGFRSDGFRSFEGKKFMIGSGSNQCQRNEVVPCGMWKTGEGDHIHSGLANPHPQIQSPSCFHSFGIMSNKAEDGLFRLDGRYNDGSSVGGLRSGRSEPVEFSFLTGRSEHNPHALQGDSRIFSYNTAVEQAFDSSFWIRKNAMMPNMAGRNLVTSVCAWCRNEFHLQAIHSETQAGIGSLCPACSAGMSGQVNML